MPEVAKMALRSSSGHLLQQTVPTNEKWVLIVNVGQTLCAHHTAAAASGWRTYGACEHDHKPLCRHWRGRMDCAKVRELAHACNHHADVLDHRP